MSGEPSDLLVLRELRLMRGALEANTAEMKLLREGGSTLRDEHGELKAEVVEIDTRVRDLEAERAERAVANNRKPPILPWRLLLTALSAASLALAGAHLLFSLNV